MPDIGPILQLTIGIMIVVLLAVAVIWAAISMFLNKLHKLMYGKGTIFAWLPLFQVYLLGKLTINKSVGWGLVLCSFVFSTSTSTLNGVTVDSSFIKYAPLRNLLSTALTYAEIGLLIYAIIKYMKLKKGVVAGGPKEEVPIPNQEVNQDDPFGDPTTDQPIKHVLPEAGATIDSIIQHSPMPVQVPEQVAYVTPVTTVQMIPENQVLSVAQPQVVTTDGTQIVQPQVITTDGTQVIQQVVPGVQVSPTPVQVMPVTQTVPTGEAVQVVQPQEVQLTSQPQVITTDGTQVIQQVVPGVQVSPTPVQVMPVTQTVPTGEAVQVVQPQEIQVTSQPQVITTDGTQTVQQVVPGVQVAPTPIQVMPVTQTVPTGEAVQIVQPQEIQVTPEPQVITTDGTPIVQQVVPGVQIAPAPVQVVPVTPTAPTGVVPVVTEPEVLLEPGQEPAVAIVSNVVPNQGIQQQVDTNTGNNM